MSTLFRQRIAFPNALLLLETEDDPEVPDVDGVANKWETASMLALAVQHDAEGDVDLRLVTTIPEEPELLLLFEGTLRSSRRLVQLITVYLDRIVGIRTLTQDLQLRVWGDDPRQPETVIVECLDLVEVDVP
jgi:hypothetical protein